MNIRQIDMMGMTQTDSQPRWANVRKLIQQIFSSDFLCGHLLATWRSQSAHVNDDTRYMRLSGALWANAHCYHYMRERRLQYSIVVTPMCRSDKSSPTSLVQMCVDRLLKPQLDTSVFLLLSSKECCFVCVLLCLCFCVFCVFSVSFLVCSFVVCFNVG